MLTNAEPLNPKAKVSYDEGQFTVEIPLHEYTPEELSVKTEGDVLVILAKHETQTETGSSFISKQFEQRFSLPSGVKPDSIVSSLSKDGVLSVTAPRSAPALTTTATNAPISGFKKTRGNAIEDEVFNPQTTQGTHMRDGSAKGLPHPKVSYDDD
jgi:HSP20 family molecular chaperone IbpA